jgi:cytochrome b
MAALLESGRFGRQDARRNPIRHTLGRQAARAAAAGMRRSAGGVLVWDLPVRVAHWLIVVCVAGSWATHYGGVEWFAWHRRLGYAVLVLVAFRITWGFVGTRHARFRQFLRGPRAVAGYLLGRTGREAAGHNPVGGWSVVAMLALLLAQATTGLFANDEILNAGPFYGWVGHSLSNRLTSLHRFNSDVLLIFIALHVAAVAWHAIARRRPLVRAMLTGRKAADSVPESEGIDGSGTARAILITAAIVAALAAVLAAAPEATIALF